MFHTFNNKKPSWGFTVVELIVVITVLGILAGILFTTFDDLYQSNVKAIATTTQVSDTRAALRTVEDNLTLSSGVLATFTPSSSPLGADNNTADWRYDDPTTGSAGQALISQSYASNGDPQNTSRSLIIDSTSPNGCTSASTSVFVKNTTVFFVRNGELYRRTLTGGNACPSTPSMYQKQTCGRGISAAVCQATDALLLTDVSKFTINYYASATDTIPIDVKSASASTDIATAKALDITIETTRLISGNNNVSTATTRLALPSQ